MTGLTESILAVLDRAARLLAYEAGALLIALALLTLVDVTLRGLAGSTALAWLNGTAFERLIAGPIFGAQDIAEVGLSLVVFGSIAFCGRTGGHVSVDIFVNLLGERGQRISNVIVRLLAVVIFVFLTWKAAERSILADQYDATTLLEIQRWPFYLFIAIGAGLYTLILIAELMLHLLGGAPEEAG